RPSEGSCFLNNWIFTIIQHGLVSPRWRRTMKVLPVMSFLIVLVMLVFGGRDRVLVGRLETTEESTATNVPSTIKPLSWPLTVASDQQIKEANACDAESVATERYPKSLASNALDVAFEPKSACDWAALAFAYFSRAEENK